VPFVNRNFPFHKNSPPPSFYFFLFFFVDKIQLHFKSVSTEKYYPVREFACSAISLQQKKSDSKYLLTKNVHEHAAEEDK
jgi:hypothetical protein